jgi:hypothetical protein
LQGQQYCRYDLLYTSPYAFDWPETPRKEEIFLYFLFSDFWKKCTPMDKSPCKIEGFPAAAPVVAKAKAFEQLRLL